jgi:hypothetical protein
MTGGYDESPTSFEKCMGAIWHALAIIGCVSAIIAICCFMGYQSSWVR